MYTQAAYDSLQRLLASTGVELVLSGHLHAYGRREATLAGSGGPYTAERVVVGAADVSTGVVGNSPGYLVVKVTGNGDVHIRHNQVCQNVVAAAGDGGVFRCEAMSEQSSTVAWPQYGTPAALCDMSFPTLDIGYAVTPWTSASPGPVYTTSNGGKSWSAIQSEPALSTSLRSVCFVDASTGWVTGDFIVSGRHKPNKEVIRKTTDGGATWLNQDASGSADLLDISFADAQNGIAVGSGGTVLHTADGGTNWYPCTITPTTTSDLRAVRCVKTDTGYSAWCVGAGGTIIQSSWTGSDTTLAFQTVTSGTTAQLNGVTAVKSSAGPFYCYAVGNSGTVLRSSDNGSTWIAEDSTVSADLQAVEFGDQNYGWIVGKNGTILRTMVGGRTWTAWWPSGTTKDLGCLALPGPGHGWRTTQTDPANASSWIDIRAIPPDCTFVSQATVYPAP